MSSKDKWLTRAETYMEIFRTKGHAAATDYLMRFGDKADKVISAIEEVQDIHEELAEEYRAEMKAKRQAIEVEKKILGVGPILPDFEKEEG